MGLNCMSIVDLVKEKEAHGDAYSYTMNNINSKLFGDTEMTEQSLDAPDCGDVEQEDIEHQVLAMEEDLEHKVVVSMGDLMAIRGLIMKNKTILAMELINHVIELQAAEDLA